MSAMSTDKTKDLARLIKILSMEQTNQTYVKRSDGNFLEFLLVHILA